ncbi:hypothetical protein KAM447_41740 [Aeromonas caviae]|nr:hypothetical protein KAM447_41740 [Aeromonas caviae]
MSNPEYAICEKHQSGPNGLIDLFAAVGNRCHIAQYMGPAQLTLAAVDETVSCVLVCHQHAIQF